MFVLQSSIENRCNALQKMQEFIANESFQGSVSICKWLLSLENWNFHRNAKFSNLNKKTSTEIRHSHWKVCISISIETPIQLKARTELNWKCARNFFHSKCYKNILAIACKQSSWTSVHLCVDQIRRKH